MIDGKGDQERGSRDGNLSSIIGAIRDDGPATSSNSPGPSWVADDALDRGDRVSEAPAPTRLSQSPAPSPGPAAMLGSPAWPPKAAVDPRLPAGGVSPSPEPQRARQGRSGVLRLAVALLIAAAIAGAVVLSLYREPLLTALPQLAVPAGEDALRKEIRALQNSIATLSERVEAVAGDGETLRRAAAALDGRLQQASGTVPAEREAQSVQRLEIRLEDLADRLDSIGEQVSRLLSDAGRAQALALTEPAPEASAVGAPAEPRADLSGEATAEPTPAASAAAEDALPIKQSSALSTAAQQPDSAASPARDRAASATGETGSAGQTPIGTAGGAPAGDAVAAAEQRSQPAETERAGVEVFAVPPAPASGPQVPADPPDAPQTVAADPSMPDEAQDRLQQMAAILEQEMTSLAGAAFAAAPEEVAAAKPAAAPKPAPAAKRPKPLIPAPAKPEKAAAWFVNLIALSRESPARDLQREWSNQGVETEVVPIRGGKLFGLRIGGFSSQAAAIARAAELKLELGISDVWIARQ